MTDKQIIIDGVDVSFCPNHYNGWSRLHRDTRSMCECGYSRECSPREFECSYYVKCLEKKLQAKKQECERLTSKCSQLKQTLTEIKEFFNEECIICKENYINITGEICEECKYKDILQKISEVCNDR